MLPPSTLCQSAGTSTIPQSYPLVPVMFKWVHRITNFPKVIDRTAQPCLWNRTLQPALWNSTSGILLTRAFGFWSLFRGCRGFTASVLSLVISSEDHVGIRFPGWVLDLDLSCRFSFSWEIVHVPSSSVEATKCLGWLSRTRPPWMESLPSAGKMSIFTLLTVASDSAGLLVSGLRVWPSRLVGVFKGPRTTGSSWDKHMSSSWVKTSF